jgi:hypothetical protein
MIMVSINIAFAKGLVCLFHSARWKAYLQQLQDNQDIETKNIENILHAFHSQLWFTREENNGHQKAAEEHLKRSEALIKDCTKQVDALEKTLANTPKPSEMLDWGSVTPQDLV